MRTDTAYGASRRSGSTSRPLYVPQVPQTRCGRFGCPHWGQTFTTAALIACVARRLSRRDFEVFRLGTAISAAHYSHNPAVDRNAVLAEFDRLSRREVVSSDPNTRVERDERSTLFIGEDWSAVLWTDLDETNADEEIARLVARLRELPGHVEWKLYSHDRPADLAQRLAAAGLVPDDEEALVVAEAAAVPTETDVDVRVARSPEEIDVFVGLNDRAFGVGHAGVGRELKRALEQDEPPMLAVVCFVDGEPASGARIDFVEGSPFAGLYGGATLPEYRGRGLYRATVAKRAELARERGYRYLQVDALPTSRPILERIGFVQLTTTTPYLVPSG
jgi:ribosomal protein S18 acetylase RimI-like enzyme